MKSTIKLIFAFINQRVWKCKFKSKLWNGILAFVYCFTCCFLFIWTKLFYLKWRFWLKLTRKWTSFRILTDHAIEHPSKCLPWMLKYFNNFRKLTADSASELGSFLAGKHFILQNWDMHAFYRIIIFFLLHDYIEWNTLLYWLIYFFLLFLLSWFG